MPWRRSSASCCSAPQSTAPTPAGSGPPPLQALDHDRSGGFVVPGLLHWVVGGHNARDDSKRKDERLDAEHEAADVHGTEPERLSVRTAPDAQPERSLTEGAVEDVPAGGVVREDKEYPEQRDRRCSRR